MTEKVTLQEIAHLCGVSLATVSLALNHRPGVSAAKRQEILAAAERLGYSSRGAQSVYPGRLNTLGLLIKSEPGLLPPSNPFYSRILAGVDEACQEMGISLLFSMLPVDEQNRPMRLPPFVESGGADGFLMVGTFLDESIATLLAEKHLPIVLVDGYSDTERYDMVISDNFRAAYQAVEYLIGQGHRHIGLVGGGPACYPSLQERRNGYLRAMKENGMAQTYLADCGMDPAGVLEAATCLLRENPHLTAIFGLNDKIAVEVIRAAQKLGLRIPQDLSVMGYDDTDLATSISPALTTMHVDTVAMGQGAVHLVSMRMRRPDAARVSLVVHPALVERDSVAAPRLT